MVLAMSKDWPTTRRPLTDDGKPVVLGASSVMSTARPVDELESAMCLLPRADGAEPVVMATDGFEPAVRRRTVLRRLLR